MMWNTIFFMLAALTYNSNISIDGKINMGTEWYEDELVIPDSPNDCATVGNEIYGIFLTWDRENLYIAASYEVQNKALLVVIDAGRDRGVHDINNLDWYPRNFQFFGMNADIVIALWNGDLGTGGVREITGEVIQNRIHTIPLSNISVQNTAFSGDSGGIEVKIPWSSLYGSNTVPPGLNIKLVGLIAGSDHEGGIESAPDNKYIQLYQSSPIRTFAQVIVDSDNDGIPDDSVSPVSVTSIINTPEKTLKISLFQISKRTILPGEKAIFKIQVTDYSSISFSIYDERGNLIFEKILENAEPDREYSFEWDGRDMSGRDVPQGFYIVMIKAGEYVREKKAIAVIR